MYSNSYSHFYCATAVCVCVCVCDMCVYVQDSVVQDIHHVRKQNARIQLQNSYSYVTQKDHRVDGAGKAAVAGKDTGKCGRGCRGVRGAARGQGKRVGCAKGILLTDCKINTKTFNAQPTTQTPIPLSSAHPVLAPASAWR